MNHLNKCNLNRYLDGSIITNCSDCRYLQNFDYCESMGLYHCNNPYYECFISDEFPVYDTIPDDCILKYVHEDIIQDIQDHHCKIKEYQKVYKDIEYDGLMLKRRLEAHINSDIKNKSDDKKFNFQVEDYALTKDNNKLMLVIRTLNHTIPFSVLNIIKEFFMCRDIVTVNDGNVVSLKIIF